LQFVLTAAGIAAFPLVAWANAFQINEHSAGNTGRNNAVVATVDDPSAIFYNPAGLTNIEGNEAEVGLSMIRPTAEYQGPGLPSTRPPGADSVDQRTTTGFLPAPHAYIARALSPKAFVGFGVYVPYGLSLAWGPDSNGDAFVGRTSAQEISLQTLFLTPAIALKLSDQVQVAVSVSLVPASVYLRRTLGASDNGQVLFPASQYGSEATVQFNGTAFGVGANAGIIVTPIEHLKLGLSFRSAVGLDFSGKVHFNVPATAPASIRQQFPDGAVTTQVTLPHVFSLGVGWVDGPLTVEADLNYTLWSSFDQLRIDFAQSLPQASTANHYNYNNVPTLRLGGEYRFDVLAVRLGVGYDWTPVPDTTVDPTLPDNNRFLISAGIGRASTSPTSA
jgi:long-chain fatty acid transport protein